MKRILIFCLSLLLTVGSRSGAVCAQAVAETAAAAADHPEEETPKVIDIGVTVNGIYYRVPTPLKQFLEDGWRISSQMPYFLPLVSEDYYAARTNLSLSKDGTGIRATGRIIRLLEKDGELLEVTIANQDYEEKNGKYQKIEEGIVDSITVFYNDRHTSIKVNGIELNRLSYDALLAAYPAEEGWTHAPGDYGDYPQFGVWARHEVEILDNWQRSICVYFNLQKTAFEVTVSSKMPVHFYSQ